MTRVRRVGVALLGAATCIGLLLRSPDSDTIRSASSQNSMAFSGCDVALNRTTPPLEGYVGRHIELSENASSDCQKGDLAIAFAFKGSLNSEPAVDGARDATRAWLQRTAIDGLRISVLGKAPLEPILRVSSDKSAIRLALTDVVPPRTSEVVASQAFAAMRDHLRETRILPTVATRTQRALFLLSTMHTGDGSSVQQVADQLHAEGVDVWAIAGAQSGFHNAVSERRQLFEYRQLEEVGPLTARALRAMELSEAIPSINTLTVTTTLSPNSSVVTNTLQPGAVWDPQRRTITWQRQGSPGVIDTKYSVIPRICGDQIVVEGTHAVAVDSAGSVYERRIGDVRIDVACPSATPPASATPTPTKTSVPPTTTWTPTTAPSPTKIPTRIPDPIHLPIALTERCAPNIRRADIVLALDASTSMREPAGGSRSKLAVALDAVRRFVDVVGLDAGDQVSIIQFNADARVLTPLTDNRSAVDAAIARVETQSTTCLPCAVEAAAEELRSERRRPDNTPVLVLLTDGRSNPRPVSEAVAAAADAKNYGVKVFTIGLGSELERDALSSIASRPGDFYEAPDPEDLATIYEQIAVEIPCPPSRFWGNR